MPDFIPKSSALIIAVVSPFLGMLLAGINTMLMDCKIIVEYVKRAKDLMRNAEGTLRMQNLRSALVLNVAKCLCLKGRLSRGAIIVRQKNLIRKLTWGDK